MTFRKLAKELDCDNYYVVEIVRGAKDDSDCPEYFVNHEDLEEELDYEVIDYEHISASMAIVYLSVPEKEEKDISDEIRKTLFENDVCLFLEAARNLVSNFSKSATITIVSDPKTESFTVDVDGLIKVPFAYDEVR